MVRAVQATLFMAGIAYTHATCYTVTGADTQADHQECYTNVLWAKQTGILTQANLYVNYTGLTEASSNSAFQCVLWLKGQNGIEANGAEGHNCSEPCQAYPEWGCHGNTSAVGGVTGAAPGNEESGGFPWWGWLLIVLGICCVCPCLALMCASFLCYEAVAFILDPLCGGKNKPQKKKRAVKKPIVAPEAPAAVAPATTSYVWVPAPVATTAVPMPVYTAAPVTTAYAAPMVTTAQPVTTAVAPPMMYAAPAGSVSYAPAFGQQQWSPAFGQ